MGVKGVYVGANGRGKKYRPIYALRSIERHAFVVEKHHDYLVNADRTIMCISLQANGTVQEVVRWGIPSRGCRRGRSDVTWRHLRSDRPSFGATKQLQIYISVDQGRVSPSRIRVTPHNLLITFHHSVVLLHDAFRHVSMYYSQADDHCKKKPPSSPEPPAPPILCG